MDLLYMAQSASTIISLVDIRGSISLLVLGLAFAPDSDASSYPSFMGFS
jgi:hypothetical protein